MFVRDLSSRFLHRFGTYFTFPLVFIVVAFLFVLPLRVNRKNFIDENAMSQGIRHPIFGNRPAEPDTTIHWSSRYVHAHRTTGSEVTVVYVNQLYPHSVALANDLVTAMSADEFVGTDVLFYMVDPTSTEEWPLPSQYVRAAFTLNVSSMRSRDVCIDIYGTDSILPNQDMVNVLVRYFSSLHLKPDLLCQSGVPPEERSTHFSYFMAALRTGATIGNFPQGWHGLRHKGINAVAISNPPWEVHPNSKDMREWYTFSLEQMLRTIGFLDERLHHSAAVWIPLSNTRYVEYDTAQFSIILGVLSFVSSALALYKQGELFLVSPLVFLLWLAPLVLKMAMQEHGTVGFIINFAVLSFALVPVEGTTIVVSFNAVFLVFLLVLQPCMGILGGTAVSLQLLFLNCNVRRVLPLIFGAFFSWGVVYLFVFHLGLYELTRDVSSVYTTWVMVPNAIWITSRALKLIHKSVLRSTPTTLHESGTSTANRNKKKKE